MKHATPFLYRNEPDSDSGSPIFRPRSAWRKQGEKAVADRLQRPGSGAAHCLRKGSAGLREKAGARLSASQRCPVVNFSSSMGTMFGCTRSRTCHNAARNFRGEQYQGPSAISHSMASSKEVNTLTGKPRFWAQSAKNPTRSNRSRGHRRAVFRENAFPSSLS